MPMPSAVTLASRRRGVGELLDLSMLETQILGLTYYPVTYFQMLGRPWRDARKLTVPGIACAKDGLVDVGCGTAQQWFDLCAMVGHQEWIDEESPLSITEQANEKATEIYSWFESRSVDDIRDLATAFRIPNAPVANGANITELDQFQHRRTFVANPRDGFTQPGPPVPNAARDDSPAASGSAAGRTHRAIPRVQTLDPDNGRWRQGRRIDCRSAAYACWT